MTMRYICCPDPRCYPEPPHPTPGHAHSLLQLPLFINSFLMLPDGMRGICGGTECVSVCVCQSFSLSTKIYAYQVGFVYMFKRLKLIVGGGGTVRPNETAPQCIWIRSAYRKFCLSLGEQTAARCKYVLVDFPRRPLFDFGGQR